LNKTEINHHTKQINEAQEVIDHKRRKATQHEWYLRYHVSPPANWMNDPNGFCFYRGEGHLFYQHDPFSPDWGLMHWGHVKSKDLVHWEHLPIALAPGEPYDADGCFSGSAIEKDGLLYVMYTGNVFTGTNLDEDLRQTQAIAVSKDGIHFEKHRSNPVIRQAPAGDVHPKHFRDPKVWQHGDLYYAVIGAKTKTITGQVLKVTLGWRIKS
jgi:beta-fructofuranosidase